MKTITEPRKTDGSIFRAVVKGKNFMTPYLLGYYAVPNGEAELTEGDFMGNEMFGVTVVINGENAGLSKCLYSKEEAFEYINSLND